MKKVTIFIILISLAAACSEDVKPLNKIGTERKGDEPADPKDPAPSVKPST